MGEMIVLKAPDGFELGAYRAAPAGKPKAGLVIVQEIFGVNAHIRSVADSYAREGYLCIAPALFDRIEKNVQLSYEGEDRKRAMALLGAASHDKALLDIAAAIDAAGTGGKVGVIGYCWGGALTFLASARLGGLSAAIAYYAGGVGSLLGEKPRVPIIFHFGERDIHIPLSDVEKVKAANPAADVYVYPADHGFNRDVGAAYDRPSAELARTRSLAFLEKTLK